MNKDKAISGMDNDGWFLLIDKIVASFEQGSLISHEWLKSSLLIDEIDMKDYDNTHDLIKAVELKQFEYMALVDKLRWEILDRYKVFFKNVRGDGYTLLPPFDQVEYAYKKAIRDIKKTISQSSLILENVNIGNEDNDLKNKRTANKIKLSLFKQMLSR